ncbi:MAG TPA: hypothetical protein VNL77_20130 [Roseiflexaceae bacterium]|nr:hypothetical protein [Roseiflexaceae bacterium]
MMPNTLFAVLLGLGAIAGLASAARAWGQGPAGRQSAAGLLVFAIAAVVQVVHLLTAYNWWLSALLTLVMFVGLWMGLPRPRRAP